MDRCEFCGVGIPKTETPFILEDKIICTRCYRKVLEQQQTEMVERPAQVEQVRTKYGESLVHVSDFSRVAAMKLGFYVGVGFFLLSVIVAIVGFFISFILQSYEMASRLPR